MSGFDKFIRFILIGGSIAAVIILVLLLTYARPFFTAGKEVNARIAKLKAEGKPVSVQDLIPPKVPDSRNAAIIYEQIFKKLDDLSYKENDEELLYKMVIASKRNEKYSKWDEARKIAVKYRSIIPMVEEAVRKPECRFNINWDAKPQNIQYKHYSKIRSLARLLSALTVIGAKDGDIRSSMHLFELNLNVSKSLSSESTLIGHLCYIAAISISCSSLRGIMNYGDIDESDAKQLYDTLSDIDMNKSWETAMLGERAFGLSMFNIYRNDPASALQSQSGGIPSNSTSPNKSRLFWTLITAKDELFYLKYMEKIIKESGLPYRESKKVNIIDDIKFPKYALMSMILLPIYSKSMAARDYNITEINGSMISLALKAYKSRYGSYPKDLGELRSKLGRKIPEDPFSGKDFIYSKKGRGFFLYSIGQNLKDDGGKVREKYKEGSAPDENYDIVWDVKR